MYVVGNWKTGGRDRGRRQGNVRGERPHTGMSMARRSTSKTAAAMRPACMVAARRVLYLCLRTCSRKA